MASCGHQQAWPPTRVFARSPSRGPSAATGHHSPATLTAATGHHSPAALTAATGHHSPAALTAATGHHSPAALTATRRPQRSAPRCVRRAAPVRPQPAHRSARDQHRGGA
eukprot:365676-Chlamydomonas_euryale.AAC.1